MAAILAETVLGRSMMRAVPRRNLAAQCSRRSAPLRRFSSVRAPWVKKYTQDHEWIELSDDGEIGTIGVSEYAANALGDVVFVELPTADLEVSAGDSIGAVESVKSASDIMTPVSGTITEGNSLLEDKPGTINKSPEGEGWIAKIRVKSKDELEGLMDAQAYKDFTELESAF
ncbi:glycine cleavage system H-protein subunit [Taxawa tesnikishii (nom. ined.)]|nr:glycine cleavage system H-protein subunit [Dothideales sp. JES 119]